MEHEDLGLEVSRSVVLTEHFLSQRMIRVHGEEYVGYHRHLNGGGWIADNSYVPFELCVPVDVTVGPNTRLLDDQNIFGLAWIEGSSMNRIQIGRVMTDQDRMDLDQQYFDVVRWLRAEKYWKLRLARQVYLYWRLYYRCEDFQDKMIVTVYWQAMYAAQNHHRMLADVS